MSSPYELLAGYVDKAVSLVMRARTHRTLVSANQANDDRVRWLRGREELVSEINTTRTNVSNVGRRVALAVPAEILSLARRANAELNTAMSVLMQPLPTSAPPSRPSTPPSSSGRSSSGRREAETEGLAEAYAFLAEASLAENRRSHRPARPPQRSPASVADQAHRGRERSAAREPEPPTLKRPPAPRPDEPAPPTQRSPGNDALPPTRREPRGSKESSNEHHRPHANIQRNAIATQAVKRWVARGQHDERQRSARRRFHHAAAPAFAAAFDRVVPAATLARLAAAQPGLDTAKLRIAFVRLATTRFATEFVRLIAGVRSGAPEKAVLNALIAAAIAQAAQQTKIVPAAAIPVMTDVVFKTLSSSLPMLAKLVLIAIGFQAARPAAPTREAQPEAEW